jgi:hypothetical protein
MLHSAIRGARDPIFANASTAIQRVVLVAVPVLCEFCNGRSCMSCCYCVRKCTGGALAAVSIKDADPLQCLTSYLPLGDLPKGGLATHTHRRHIKAMRHLARAGCTSHMHPISLLLCFPFLLRRWCCGSSFPQPPVALVGTLRFGERLCCNTAAGI